MASTDTSRLMEVIKRKIFLILGRGIVKAVTSSGKVQKVQITGVKDEVISEIEQMQPYGLEARPKIHNTTEATIIFFGGNRDQGVILNILDRAYRPKDLSEGEVCLFDFNDSRVWLKSDGTLKIIDKDGNYIKTTSTGWRVEDKNGNYMESNATQWNLNGNLTVDK